MSATTLTVPGVERRPAPDPQIRVEVVSDYQGFLDLEPLWNNLTEETGLEHPFLEHVWVRTWWECFGKGSSLFVLIARAGDRPIAIAPLILRRARMWGVPVRMLGFFYNPHVPRADFIIAERAAEVYQAFWACLRGVRGWDVLQLSQLPEGSPTLEHLLRLTAADGYPAGMWLSGASPFLNPGRSWEEHWNKLTPKHRSNVRNRLRRLEQVGPVDISVVASDHDLDEALETGLRLEAAAWKGENRTAISSEAARRRFYETFAHRAAGRGWLLLHFLRVGSRPVAFDYSLCYKSKIYLLKVGYDPEYAKFSPYNLLMRKVLEDLVQRGVAEYDFLGDNEAWKQSWTTQTRPHYWLFIFSNTSIGRFLHRMKFRWIPVLRQYRLCRLLLARQEAPQARRECTARSDN